MKDKFGMVGQRFGEEIPAFSLPNSRGSRVGIMDLRGRNVVVMLLRGLMDPYCRGQVFRIAKELEKFKTLNAEIYAITADRFENARRLELRYVKEAFPIYFDKTHEVVRMLNQEVKVYKLGRLPAILIVDKQGVVQWAYYGESFLDIPKNSMLLEILEKLDKA